MDLSDDEGTVIENRVLKFLLLEEVREEWTNKYFAYREENMKVRSDLSRSV